MQELRIGYARWKTIVQANLKAIGGAVDDFRIAHVFAGGDGSTGNHIETRLCAGNREFLYLTTARDADDSDWSSTFAAHSELCALPPDAIAHVVGTPITEKRQSDGRSLVATSRPVGGKINIITIDWCDATTWYPQAVRVVDETATPQNTIPFVNTATRWGIANENVIDTYHGKLTGEDGLTDADGNSFRVVVKVNGATKMEQDPHTGSGGDYTINYADGTVTFFSGVSTSTPPSVTYHYANGSQMTIKPKAGKVLSVQAVECQFSRDFVMTDSVTFSPYGPIDVFAPQLLQSNGGPYPPGTMIPIATPDVYKSVRDFLNDSNHSYPVVPKFGGNGWRGLPADVQIMRWDYSTASQIYASYGMEVRIKLEHDIPFTGSYATATLYCTSEDE